MIPSIIVISKGLPNVIGINGVQPCYQLRRSGPVFCLLLGVSSDYAQPITGQVTEVTCPVIGRAQTEPTPSKRQKMGPDFVFSGLSLLVCIQIPQLRFCWEREPYNINLNKLGPCNPYMRLWNLSSLVQMIACRMFGAKSLPQSRLTTDSLAVNNLLAKGIYKLTVMLIRARNVKAHTFCSWRPVIVSSFVL